MCFSATASFTASATLGVIGVATLIKTKNKKDWLLSSIPLIFAIQQFMEGWLWLSIQYWPAYTLNLTYIFLFFALFLWPMYVPFIILLLETNKIRKNILSIICLAGAIVGTLFYLNFLSAPQAAQVVNQCLFYPNQISYPDILKYLYILIIIFSGLASSRKIIKLFCFLVFVSSIITYFFYAVHFTSVWCYFAAIISVIIFLKPKENEKIKS